MSHIKIKSITEREGADPRWRELYRIGAVFSVLIAISVILAIVAFFIWPFKPGFTSTENIFMTLHVDRLGGLMSLDLPMLLIAPMNIFMFLALYSALKQVNESYALIALVLALLAIALLISSRPIMELVSLSEKYAMAATDLERQQYLAAGEALHASFNGTAWAAQTVLFMLAGLIDCWLMLRTRFFGRATAWLGIVISIVGLGFFLPGVGLVLLFVNTVGSIIWCILLARDLFRSGWDKSGAPQLRRNGA